jgi:cell filamentation protein
MDNSHTIPEDAQDNKLGLFNMEDINYVEAMGITRAKAYVIKIYDSAEISIDLLKDLHRKAFGHLYDWAGKIRTTITNIGVPPFQILSQLKMFLDNLKYRMEQMDIDDEEEVIQLLAEVHHSIVKIHPFINGNGRLARLFTNLIALKLMRPPFEIYIRENSDDRKHYISAIKEADKGDYTKLKELVKHAIDYSIERFEMIEEENKHE